MKSIFALSMYSDGKEYRNCLVTIEKGLIQSVEFISADDDRVKTAQQVECLAPGFIDIHINGGEDLHFTETPTQEAIEDIASSSRATGVAYVLPTCITSSWENIKNAISATKSYLEENPTGAVLGMHLEGPFINPVKRGAHLKRFILPVNDHYLEELIELGSGVIKLCTIAPEYFTEQQIIRLQENGIRLSSGHSNATYIESFAGFSAGIRLVTHLYNAMSPLGHREPGLVGAIFDFEEGYAPLIVDGVHCDYAAARIAYKQKKEKLILISDALFLGKKKKRFQWEEFDATLSGDRYTNSEGNLAGGALSLPEIFKKAIEEVGVPVKEAVDMVTRRPIDALKLDSNVGRLAPDFRAVFTAFDYDFSHFEVIDFQ